MLKWENEIKDLQYKKSQMSKQLDERHHRLDDLIRQTEQKNQEELKDIQAGHFNKLRELDNELGEK